MAAKSKKLKSVIKKFKLLENEYADREEEYQEVKPKPSNSPEIPDSPDNPLIALIALIAI